MKQAVAKGFSDAYESGNGYFNTIVRDQDKTELKKIIKLTVGVGILTIAACIVAYFENKKVNEQCEDGDPATSGCADSGDYAAAITSSCVAMISAPIFIMLVCCLSCAVYKVRLNNNSDRRANENAGLLDRKQEEDPESGTTYGATNN